MSDLIPGITVVIPTIPPRVHLLERAHASVAAAAGHWRIVADMDPSLPVPMHWTSPAQEGLQGEFTLACEVVPDLEHLGAARTRHAGLMNVATTWTAFLDDDDEFLPDHLVVLYRAALEHGADYLWSRFRIVYPDGSTLAGPAFLGAKAFSQWNDEDPCQTTITTLVRTELAREAGGFAQFEEDGREVDGHRRGEDHDFTRRCRAAGAVMRHVPEVTWCWHHHDANTSGMPDRW